MTETSFTAKKEWELSPQDLEFTDKLGEGTSAKVYKAKYKGEVVAVKILKTEGDSEAGGPKVDFKKLVRDFQQECEIMSKISGPYILKFYGALVQPRVCIVLEYCSKGSLYHLLSESNVEFGWKQVLRWTREMVLGIQTLHSCNPPIYHRDLKSLNLLLDNDMKVKVCDFGLARLSEGDTATLGKMRGTYAYCAPELYKATLYTKHSDVYSMAIILWEMAVRCCTGKYQRPFQEYDKIKLGYTIIVKAAKENLRPTIPEGMPPEVKRLIESMWSSVPEDRPLTDELLQKIEEIEKAINVSSGKELNRNVSYRFELTRDDAHDLGAFQPDKVHIKK